MQEITIGDIERRLRQAGVDLWGVAANDPPLPLAPTLPRAISIGMRLRPEAIAGVEHGPTLAYLNEYRRLNLALGQITESLVAWLHLAGYKAERIRPTIADKDVDDWSAAGVFPHKTAATRAGLGWIGKTALFVSPELGPKLRLATVFTDLDLPVGGPVTSGRCGSCHLCVDACPAKAGHDVQWLAGMAREALFDARACERQLDANEEFGGVCGICVAVCPFGAVG
ncbi:MAG TPA: 4Fe-4S double cluster binding domain-containing protein [Thermoleophilia bacterium]|nr:4Fe-4S double cluster binding domain-containing protein [Thermoleophilia bacterium]